MKPHALKDHVKHMSGNDKREYHKLYLKYLEFLERELPACIRISFDKKLNQVVYPGGKPEIFKKTYRSYQSWKSVKKEMDPDNLFKSDLSIRLKM